MRYQVNWLDHTLKRRFAMEIPQFTREAAQKQIRALEALDQRQTGWLKGRIRCSYWIEEVNRPLPDRGVWARFWIRARSKAQAKASGAE